MNFAYRNVKMICQNNSMQSLILTGFSALKGNWSKEPIAGEVVAANGANAWTTQTNDLNSGCGGYITLICSEGYVILSWLLPWIGELEYEVSHPACYRAQVRMFLEDPDAPVLQVTLWGEAQAGMEHAQLAGSEPIRQLQPATAQESVSPPPALATRRERPGKKKSDSKKPDQK